MLDNNRAHHFTEINVLADNSFKKKTLDKNLKLIAGYMIDVDIAAREEICAKYDGTYQYWSVLKRRVD